MPGYLMMKLPRSKNAKQSLKRNLPWLFIEQKELSSANGRLDGICSLSPVIFSLGFFVCFSFLCVCFELYTPRKMIYGNAL
jgi:hypothetical protein